MSESRAKGIRGSWWRVVLGGGALLVLLLCGSYVVWAIRLPHLLILYTLPVPPEAQMVYDARRSLFGDMVFSTDIFYRINDRSAPDMASYYQREMGERGWRLVAEEKRGSSSCTVFQRGPFLTSVEVLAGTSVTLRVGSSSCDTFYHDVP